MPALDKGTAFDNIAAILKPCGEALISFPASVPGYDAHAVLKDDPKWAPYCKVKKKIRAYYRHLVDWQ